MEPKKNKECTCHNYEYVNIEYDKPMFEIDPSTGHIAVSKNHKQNIPLKLIPITDHQQIKKLEEDLNKQLEKENKKSK
jgi:hypothetical protein